MSIKIDKQNYEAYYLDYLEGNLGIEATAQLLLFLENHPELKLEEESFADTELSAEEHLSFDKSTLKQFIDEGNVEDYIIESIEQEISEEDAVDLEKYLQTNPTARILAQRYQKTILPKEDVIYPDKRRLKKGPSRTTYLIRIASAAAVALMLVYFVVPPTNSSNLSPEIAGTSDPKVKQNPSNQERKEFVAPEPGPAQVEESVVNEAVATQMEGPKNTPERKAIPTQQYPGTLEPDAKNITEEVVVQQVQPSDIMIPEKRSAAQKDNQTPAVAEVIEPPQEPSSIEDIQKLPELEERVVEVVIPDLLDEQEVSTDVVLDEPTAVVGAESEPVVAEATEGKKALKVGEWANKNIREKVLKSKSKSTRRIKGNEIIAAVVDKIDDNTKTDIVYNHSRKDQKKSFSLAIGKFKISRTKFK